MYVALWTAKSMMCPAFCLAKASMPKYAPKGEDAYPAPRLSRHTFNLRPLTLPYLSQSKVER